MLDWIEIKNQDNDYFLKYQYKKSSMLPLEAAYYTIDYIQKNYPPPYTLMVSGGVDSQAMLYAWHTYNVPFKTFSGVYNKGMNENDLSTLRKFSEIYSIPITYVDVDVLEFLHIQHLDYVMRFRCGSPHMTTFMKMTEMINEGTVIFGGNFIKTCNPQFLPISRNNFGLYKFAKKTNRSVVPFFFCETQELAFSFEQSAVVTNIEQRNIEDYGNKIKLYTGYGFPVVRQEKKLTGFENIKDYYDKHYSHLVTVQDKFSRIIAKQSSNRTFDLLLRNKYEAMFQNDKYSIKFISESNFNV